MKMYVSKHELNGIAAEMVADSEDMAALGARILALVKAEAAKHHRTGAFERSIKMERTLERKYSGGRLRRNITVHDVWVRSDDDAAVQIEWGTPADSSTPGRGGHRPKLVFTNAFGAVS